MKKVKPRTLSGFMELLPMEQLQFNALTNIIKETYQQFGFLPLDTPLIEASDVLLAKAGGETEQQIYQIKRANNDLTLRFDLTVPLAKYVAQYYGSLNFPFRRYQIGKVYRGERAQKGRYREFYQCDLDIVGENNLSLINDAEMIYIINTLFENIKLPNFIIKINNRKLLTGFCQELNLNNTIDIMRLIDKKNKITTLAFKTELTKLNIKEQDLKQILALIKIKGSNSSILEQLKALNITNKTWQAGLTELETVYQYCNQFGLKNENLQIDLSIARGLDYYTGTVYETFYKDNINLGSLCSGGRYDNLAECYTNRKLPGVGFSLGLTRLFKVLQEANLLPTEPVITTTILIIPLTNNYDYIISCYKQLQEAKIKTQIFSEERSLKSIINYALNLNIPYVIFIGEEEVNNNLITIKNLKTHNQKTIKITDINKEIKNGNTNI